jgi:hypothetical protein
MKNFNLNGNLDNNKKGKVGAKKAIGEETGSKIVFKVENNRNMTVKDI